LGEREGKEEGGGECDVNVEEEDEEDEDGGETEWQTLWTDFTRQPTGPFVLRSWTGGAC
jgi:hypothetical protein